MVATHLIDETERLIDRNSQFIPIPTQPDNYYTADRHLQLALARYFQNDPDGWQWAEKLLSDWGAICAQQIAPLYEVAEKNEPVLKAYNQRGERVDEIVFHPGYHEIGKRVYGFGMAAMSNRAFEGRGVVSQLLKFAAMYQYCQAESSVSCPVSMTDIMARVLNKFASPDLIARYLPRLTSQNYDELYTGAMFMTEKAGGSDVGATTTVARYVDGEWRLSGDKWFCSNVGADLILTLARPENAPAGTRGLGLFLVPRLLPDNRRNSYTINRLKDKLGTRAMASGEVTLNDALAYVIEPLDRGFVMMMEMVNGTRLHTGIGGTANLRRATIEATLHARERRAFGRVLAEQPLMAEQLADLIADSQATTSLALATAHALDRADLATASREESVLSRLLITLLKRYGTSHGVQGAQIAMEIRGGNGYIEDRPNARLLRDAYVNIIWEGGINMVAFDVLRTFERENGWPVYTSAIERKLASVNTATLVTLNQNLQAAMQTLAGEVERIMKLSRAEQEIAAPALSETMAALYANVLLTTEADFGLRRGDEQAKITTQAANRYHERFVLPLLAKLARCNDISTNASDLISNAV